MMPATMMRLSNESAHVRYWPKADICKCLLLTWTSPGPKFAPRQGADWILANSFDGSSQGRHAPPIRSRVDASAVVSDVLLPHEPQLVQRGHRQRGRRQVHLLRRR